MRATAVAGAWVVTMTTHGDERGFFRETVRVSELEDAVGRPVRFVQANHARSEPGVLRGIHAEPWDKLVYVPRGRVLAVVADVREDSPTYGQHIAVRLGDDTPDRPRLFIEAGLGNAYCVLGDEPADYVYDVTREFDASLTRRVVAWDDPTLDIPWPIDEPRLSEVDATAPPLAHRQDPA